MSQFRLFRHKFSAIFLLKTPEKQCFVNGFLIVLLIIANLYFQVFCIPATWAMVLLCFCFGNTIISPLFTQTSYQSVSAFIDGISFLLFLYCVIFLETFNLYGFLLLFLGIGWLIYIPHYFLIQLFWKHIYKPAYANTRYYFLSAILVGGIFVWFVQVEYQKAVLAIEAFQNSKYQKLETGFLTEKILGMHLLYHTRICVYDGWRPPIHEPLLVIGLWLNQRKDPLNIDLQTRLNLYKSFFPDHPVQRNCSCAIQHQAFYWNDPIWENGSKQK